MSEKRQYLYGVFWTVDGKPMWAMGRNGRRAETAAKYYAAVAHSDVSIYRMPVPYGNGAWDAPTFRHCADHWKTYTAR